MITKYLNNWFSFEVLYSDPHSISKYRSSLSKLSPRVKLFLFFQHPSQQFHSGLSPHHQRHLPGFFDPSQAQLEMLARARGTPQQAEDQDEQDSQEGDEEIDVDGKLFVLPYFRSIVSRNCKFYLTLLYKLFYSIIDQIISH